MIRVTVNLQAPPEEPEVDAGELARFGRGVANGMGRAFPENQLWEVTAARGRAQYDVRNALGATKSAVQAVGPGANQIQVKDVVTVGYYSRGQSLHPIPYIRTVAGRTKWGADALRLDLWTQPLGNPGLSRSAECAVPDPGATPTVLWTSPSSLFANTPANIITLTRDRLAVAQHLAGVLYLHIISATGIETMSLAPVTGMTGLEQRMYSNDDGSFMLLIAPGDQLFRKLDSSFQSITLAGLGGLALTGAAVSPLGPLLLPGYERASGSYAVDAMTFPTSERTATFVRGLTTVWQRAWQTSSNETRIRQAWKFDPGTLIQIQRPIIFPVNQYGIPACSPDGETFTVWASARSWLLFDHGTNANLAGNELSEQLEAVVAGVNAVTGSVAWEHRLSFTAPAPIEDAGLLDGLTTFIGDQIAPHQYGTPPAGTYNTYMGRIGELALESNSYEDIDTHPDGYPGINTAQFKEYKGSEPKRSLYASTGIVMLPRAGPNDVAPREIYGGAVNNMELFTKYGSEDYEGEGGIGTGLEQSHGLVGDGEGNFYFAYLKPRPLLVGGKALYAFGEDGRTPINYSIGSKGLDGTEGLIELAVIQRDLNDPRPSDTPGYTGAIPGEWNRLEFNCYHNPGLVQVSERYLRKIGPRGQLLAEADLTQLVTASWHELNADMGQTVVDAEDYAAIGGDSSSPIPLGDNIWKIAPAGRIVFALADFHDLGPGFKPSTKLLIHNASDLSTQYDPLSLRSSEDLLEDDVLDEDEVVIYKAGDRRYGVSGALTDIRAGSVEGESEWAAVFVSQIDRLTGDNADYLQLLVNGPAGPADFSTYFLPTLAFRHTIALSNGHFLRLAYDGAWTVEQI